MYSKNKLSKTTLRVRNFQVGETIEAKVRRIKHNREPIEEGAPLIFTDPENGTPPLLNPRTDRFDLALDSIDKVEKDNIAKGDGAGDLSEKSSGSDKKPEKVKGKPKTDTPPKADK